LDRPASSRPRAGAGLLLVARRTSLASGKPILIGQRSRNVRSPLTWAAFGGWMEAGEDPATAALREFGEESGYRGPVELLPESHWEYRVGFWPLPTFTFHNFIGVAADQFELPGVPNWEVADARWMSLEEIDALPRPGAALFGRESGIHPGLLGYLGNAHIRELVAELTRSARGE
jgi:8-oxo-dGTP pyrophosphatase MutT (NUDIX family)